MLETWRWFGPDDPISLKHIAQAGAQGIVSSLHHIATGEQWPMDAIEAHKKTIEQSGLTWSVVESIPLHNDIKTRSGQYERFVENYKQSIANVGRVGIDTVCYNFMPVVDWTRTNLSYRLSNSSQALRFDMSDFAAYDIYILARPQAKNDYPPNVLEKARDRFCSMGEEAKLALEKNIIAGLPGGEGTYTRETVLKTIAKFIALGTEQFRQNLFSFLREVIPVAEASGVKMCIHPDDPPFSLFGLPRVVSTAVDARTLLAAVPSKANGLTLCAGSFGARGDNDLVAMVNEFAENIHFVHLRNVTREQDGSFYEAEHLNGDNDIVGIVNALLSEERRRNKTGIHAPIPMRPDHGHAMGDEISDPNTKPGYSYLGRLKGLAELRGVIHTLESLHHMEIKPETDRA